MWCAARADLEMTLTEEDVSKLCEEETSGVVTWHDTASIPTQINQFATQIVIAVGSNKCEKVYNSCINE